MYNPILFPYQKEGVQQALEILKVFNGVLIADEMGLGKTLTAINILDNLLTSRQGTSNILIVTPASVKYTWYYEFMKYSLLFDKDPEKFNIILVLKGSDEITTIEGKINIIICNYDLLHRPPTFRQIKRCKIDVLLADEAHYLKSIGTRRSEAVSMIISGNEKYPALHTIYKIFLSGTPVANRPIEIWNLLKLLLSHKMKNVFNTYSSYHEFGKRYANGRKLTLPFRGTHWDFTGASNLTELNLTLRQSIMIRRLKELVSIQLPQKLFKKVYLGEASSKHKKLTKSLAQLEINDILLMPINNNLATARRELGTEKLPMSINYIKDILTSTDEKLVVFAYHRDVIDGLRKGLEEYQSVIYTGDTPTHSREMAVREFQNNKDTRLFIGQIIAAGTGITLTAASHIIFVETSWALTDFNQAVDRCHRIGQHKNVLITVLTLRGSIDALVLKALVKKNNIIERVVNVQQEGV